ILQTLQPQLGTASIDLAWLYKKGPHDRSRSLGDCNCASNLKSSQGKNVCRRDTGLTFALPPARKLPAIVANQGTTRAGGSNADGKYDTRSSERSTHGRFRKSEAGGYGAEPSEEGRRRNRRFRQGAVGRDGPIPAGEQAAPSRGG